MDFSKMLNLRTMDNGSQRHVLDQMSADLAALGLPRLDGLHADALAANERANEANLRWLNQKELNETARSDARSIDHELDRQLGSLHTILKTYAEMPAGGPASTQARTVIDALFARGVAPYTTLSFNEEHNQVRALIATLRAEYTAELAAVGVSALVDQLEVINTEYGEALSRGVERISFEKVSTLREQADQLFHKFLLALIGELVDQPDILAQRLKPLYIQQKRVAEYFKRYKSIPTVDPQTGETPETPVERAEPLPLLGDAP
ncbi:DUF6261 family protein [Bradymonas sediminis]|uniref:Uncharacterized protein n=1 Tax=Bradymonas sediminis TaxID=1548548 RepID=A0A2Z4FHN4_9DELT|nr:DUF6261 family protein [Bradymonas sediminis]AWV88255.1 hypothetical protein DN745_02430 [Bradymonas sediminis]TDP77379.1 hypothetical protein DFR33_101279 [Bradymonas sediminis]